MCNPKDGPSQRLDLSVPVQHAKAIQQEILEQFQLVSTDQRSAEGNIIFTYLYLLDELTMPKWWNLMRYVKQQKFEERIVRSEMVIIKRRKDALPDDPPEEIDMLVQAEGALAIMEKFPAAMRSLFEDAAAIVRIAILSFIERIEWEDWLADYGTIAAENALANRPSVLGAKSEDYEIVREALMDLIERQRNIGRGKTLLARALNILEESPRGRPLSEEAYSAIHGALWMTINLEHTSEHRLRKPGQKEQSNV